MTLSEVKAWLEGFKEGLGTDNQSPEVLSKIFERLEMLEEYADKNAPTGVCLVPREFKPKYPYKNW